MAVSESANTFKQSSNEVATLKIYKKATFSSDYFPNFLVINLIKRNMFILHCSLALEVLYERSRTIHLQRYVLDLFKQLSNLFARIINFYKLALLFFQKYHHGCLKGSDYTSDLL